MRRALFFSLILFSACLAPAGSGSPAMSEQPVIISGMIRRMPGRNPAGGALVAAYLSNNSGGEPLAVAQSLINGSFILKLPGPGSYRLVASSGPQGALAYRSITVPAGGVNGVVLLLENTPLPPQVKGPRIAAAQDLWETVPAMKLEVVDTAGNRVRRGRLQAWVVWAPVDPAFRLNGEGTTASGVWTDVPAGTGNTVILPPQYFYRHIPAHVAIALRDSLYGVAKIILDRWPDTVIKLVLKPGAHLVGTVIDERGEPLREVEVKAAGMEKDLPFRFLQGWAWSVTGENGTFDIPALFGGRYGVETNRVYRISGALHYVELPEPTAATKHPISTASVTIRYRPLAHPRMSSLYAFGIQAAEPVLWSVWDDTPERDVPIQPQTVPFWGWTLNRQRDAKPILIKGCVRESSGLPVRNCPVELFPMSGYYPLEVATTSVDGNFLLSAPGPGPYRLMVDQQELTPRQHMIQVTPSNRSTPVVLTVGPPPVAQISVVDTDGRPVASMPIDVWISTREGGYQNTIQNTGQLPWKCQWSGNDSPKPGDPVLFGARSKTVGVGVVEMNAWPAAPVVIRLTPGIALICHVLDAAGHPVVHADVSLLRRVPGEKGYNDILSGSGEAAPANHQTDSTGTIRLSQIPPGEYQVQVQGRSSPIVLSQPVTELTIKPGIN